MVNQVCWDSSTGSLRARGPPAGSAWLQRR